MNFGPHSKPSAGRIRGFTLIELMVTLVVVAILAAVALPSFQDSVRKSRRADAFTAITAVQQAQERWRGSHADYSNSLPNTAVAPALANGLGMSTQSSSSYYTLSLSNITPTTYTVEATAVVGRSQDQDGDCKVLGARVERGNVVYGAGSAGIDWAAANPDAGRCWAR